MTEILWSLAFLAAVVLAIVAAIAQDVRRNRAATPWSPLREPETEPHSPARDDATVWRTAGPHRPIPALPAPVPVSPLLHHRHRDRRDRPQPLVHVGATEQWSPAAETSAAGQDSRLMTPAEQILADHEALAGIGAARDAFSAAMDEALAWFCRDDPALALAVSRHGPSTAADTGLYDLRELEAMLAEVPA